MYQAVQYIEYLTCLFVILLKKHLVPMVTLNNNIFIFHLMYRYIYIYMLDARCSMLNARCSLVNIYIYIYIYVYIYIYIYIHQRALCEKLIIF